ncbi:MAG: hypothetical protein H0X67_18405 [Acidobacteria bacterium]|nr:hypothetical protein [Acidobacteriota bacterium]
MTGAFALSEHLAGIALFTTPLQLAGVSPLAAYNVALILSFALSAFFTYLLVRRLLAQGGAPGFAALAGALCAGMAFGFAPYRADQLSHLQVLTTQWMPLALLAMHAYLEGGRRAWLAVLGFAWVVQALSNGYYLLFFPVLLALWFAWFVDWRHQWRRGLTLIGTYALSSVLLVPGLLQYLSVHRQFGLERRITEMRMFSGDAMSFLTPPHGLAFWPNLDFANQETFLFPGVTAVTLVLAAWLIGGRRSSVIPHPSGPPGSSLLFYALAGLAMCWLALGPALPDEPLTGRVRLYTLLTYLPGFGALRVPARFAMLGYMCLAVAAGLALGRLMPARQHARILVVALVFAGLTVDGWMAPIPGGAPPARIMLPAEEGAAVLELPPDYDEVNTAAMYRSAQHGYPLVNGYSGHVPQHYRILQDGLRRGDHTVITALARPGPLLVLVDAARDRDGHFQALLDSIPGGELLGISSAGRLFRIPAHVADSYPLAGDTLHYTLTEPSQGIAEMDLGGTRVVRMLEFPLRGRFRQLDPRIEIRTSEDRATWTTVWLGWTGGPALLGALEDQQEAPVRFMLPDVRTRYLRVRPLPAVLQSEIQVYGPR